jgi:hypothetical protein
MIEKECSDEFVIKSYKEVDNQLQTPKLISIINISFYAIFFFSLNVFHIYRTYFDPKGIGKTLEKIRLSEQAGKKGKILGNPFNIEELRTKGKILCPCIICLSNTPPPLYTRCCSQPMHP